MFRSKGFEGFFVLLLLARRFTGLFRQVLVKGFGRVCGFGRGSQILYETRLWGCGYPKP